MRVLLSIVVAAGLQLHADSNPAATIETLLVQAREAQARSDFHAAADAYRQAAALRPDVAELWSNVGLMCHESREFRQAEDAFGRALRLNQSLFVPNLFLGLDLLDLQRPREAIPYLVKAEKLDSRDPQPPLALGRAYHTLLEPEKSLASYQRAAALAPRNGDVWYGMGLAYFGLAEKAGAKLAASFWGSAYVARLAADAFVEQGRLAEARNAYRAALEAPGTRPRCTHASYGFLLILSGDPAHAQQEFASDTGCPDARVGLARLRFDSGAHHDAMALLGDLARSDPEGFDAALPRFWQGLDGQEITDRLAKLRQSGGPMAEVVAARLSNGVRSAPLLEAERPVPEFAAGGLERFASNTFLDGHYLRTALASERLMEKYPNNPAGWYWAVRANQKLGIAALARASEVEPDSPGIHALLGDVYQRRRMFEEAREEYEKVLAVSPGSVAGLAGLAAVDFADGKVEVAQDAAQRALARSPEDGEINLLMGEILVARKQYADAEPYLERALKARADLLARVHALLGRVFAMTGREAEAIEELRQGLASDDDGSVHYQLARLYQKTGNTKAAEAAFAESKRIRARNDELAQKELVPGG